MADEVRFRVTADDDDAIRAMNNVIQSVQKGEDAFQELGRESDRAFDQVAKSATQANDAIQNATTNIGLFGATLNQSTKQINLNSRAAGNLAFQLQDVFVQLSTGQGILRTLIQQGPQITSIFGGVGNTFKFAGQQARQLFRRLVTLRGGIKALAASTGILLALSVVSYLTQSGQAAEFFTTKLSQLRQITDVLINRLAALGEAVTEFFSGDRQAAAEALRRSYEGIGQALSDAAERGREFADVQRRIDALAVTSAALNIEAERRAEIARTQAQDESRALSDRIGLIRQAAALEQEARERQIGILRRQFDLANEENASLEDRAKITQELQKLEAEASTAAIETQQEVNALIQERINKTRELTDAVRQAEATLGGGAELARFQFERATEAIQRLKQEAQLIGLDLDFGPLETLAQEEFKRAVDAARGQLEELPTIAADQVDQLAQELDRAGEAVALKLAEGLQAGTLEAQPILENIRDEIQSAFDINDNQLNAIVANFGTAYGAITDAVTAETERQITAQTLVIDAIRERVDETTRLLEQEQRKAAQGYANNVSAYEKQLAEQLKAQEEAEQKRLDLERKAARQRLIINSAEQVSNYILAITKLTAAEASKGIVGIATTIAGVALIASIVARARAQASEFSELPKFRTGTEFVAGPGSGQSDSILARISAGERILTADQNRQIGGRAVSNKDLVETYLFGDTMQERLKIDRPDFSEALRRLQADQQRIAQAQQDRQLQAIKEAYRETAKEQTAELLQYLKSRPITWWDEQGNEMHERQVGGKIERKKFKDEKE